MSHDAYVGRVGGLAVALGIGIAVASGQGVASADSPDQSASPSAPESPSGTPTGQEADGVPAAVAPGPSIEIGGFSLPTPRLWDRPTHRGSLADRVEARRKLAMAAQADTKPTDAAEAPDNSVAGEDEPTAQARAADGKSGKPGGRSESNTLPAARHLLGDIVKPNADRLASVTHTVRRTVDEAPSPADTATFATAQHSPSSEPSPPTSLVNAEPVIASAAAAAPQATGIISRLLAPLGLGALANTVDTPVAPASPTTLLGGLELIRRELERLFVNKSPAVTYDSSQDIAANGAITGRVIATDPDGDDLTYTATSPAEGDVFVASDGSFTFVPNSNYDPAKGATFDVTVSDADSGFHIHGLSGLLNAVTFGLIGDSGHTRIQTVAVAGAVPPPDIDRTVVVSGLTQPTDFRFLPPATLGGPDRILFVEKTGAVKVYNGSEMQSDPVLTIPVATNWARGVNGVEVDPGFNDNGYIYVSYIGTDNIERLSRFTVTDPKADVLVADPSTEKVLLQGDQPAGDDHHGGQISYIDGKLYWATGDNVCCSTVDGSNSQDLSNIYGKVLRINPDGTIPTDNPYYNTPGARKEIYATGLRNPFRGGVTPDGQLLIGDVGQNTWEEINLVTPGANFGWPAAEGVCPGPGECKTGSDGTTKPIYAYQHGGSGGSSITSVMVYDGDELGDQYDNAIFFADHNQQWVKVMKCDAGYTACGAPTTVISQAGGTTRLAQGPDGSIYQLTLDGTLWRIAPSQTSTI
jgi:glucose/arabinose dehydrogenase